VSRLPVSLVGGSLFCSVKLLGVNRLSGYGVLDTGGRFEGLFMSSLSQERKREALSQVFRSEKRARESECVMLSLVLVQGLVLSPSLGH
jgi:hypothetical protein